MSEYLEIAPKYYAPKSIWEYCTNAFEMASMEVPTKLSNNIRNMGLTEESLQTLASYAPKPILLVGEPGVGKTSLAQRIGNHLGLTTKIISFNESMSPNDLLSNITVNNGNLTRIEGPLLQLCKLASKSDKPYLLIFDEISRASTDTQSFLIEFINDTNEHSLKFPCYVLTDPLDPSCQQVVVPRKNLFIIATANISKETFIAPALRNRFITLSVEPMPSQVLIKLLKQCGLTDNIANKIAISVEYIKQQYNEGVLDVFLSHRKVLDIVQSYILEVFSKERHSKNIPSTAILDTVIQRHLAEIITNKDTLSSIKNQLNLLMQEYDKAQNQTPSKQSVEFKTVKDDVSKLAQRML